MKHLLPTLFAGLFCAGLLAQNFKTVNSFTAGNTGTDEIRDITTDAQGNIYITGSFTDSVDFDPGPGTFYLTTPMGNKPDAFIQKLDANGNFLWAKSFRGTFNDIERGERLLVDDTGNIYMLGYFQRNIFFDVNGYQWPGNITGLQTRPFLVKLSSTGSVIWGMGWKHNSPDKVLDAFDLTVDSSGKLFVSGTFSASVDFNPEPTDTLTRTSNGSTDIFCLKLAPNGQVLDVITLGGSQSDIGYSLITLNNQIYVGGVFGGSVDFDNSSNIALLTSSGSFDCFILCLDTAFNFNWVKSFGGTSTDFLYRLFKDSNQNIYSLGSIQGQADLDPNPSNTVLINNNGAGVYIQKLDQFGNLNWAKSFGGASTVRPYSIKKGSLNEISFVGSFTGTIDVDPDPGITNTLTSFGSEDGLIIQIDSLGFFTTAKRFGGIGADVLRAIELKSNGNIYIGGSFQNTIDIDPTPNTNLVTSNGQEDMLFLELGLCAVQQDTIPVLACNQFVNPADSTVQSTNGFYTGNFLASDGCDSTVVFDVTINTIAPSVTQTIDGLAAQTQATNPTYQWLDCTTNQIIPGATNQTYMPMVNGLYAVIVSSGTCTDTSSCYTINNVALPETLLQNSITLYPNPTNGQLRIETSQPWQKAEVIDLMGRIVLSQNQPQEELDLSHLASGIYLVKVYFKEGVVVQRVIKE